MRVAVRAVLWEQSEEVTTSSSSQAIGLAGTPALLSLVSRSTTPISPLLLPQIRYYLFVTSPFGVAATGPTLVNL